MGVRDNFFTFLITFVKISLITPMLQFHAMTMTLLEELTKIEKSPIKILRSSIWSKLPNRKSCQVFILFSRPNRKRSL